MTITKTISGWDKLTEEELRIIEALANNSTLLDLLGGSSDLTKTCIKRLIKDYFLLGKYKEIEPSIHNYRQTGEMLGAIGDTLKNISVQIECLHAQIEKLHAINKGKISIDYEVLPEGIMSPLDLNFLKDGAFSQLNLELMKKADVMALFLWAVQSEEYEGKQGQKANRQLNYFVRRVSIIYTSKYQTKKLPSIILVNQNQERYLSLLIFA